MRTTVDIPDELYRKLKAKAALEGSTVKGIIVRLVEGEVQGKKRRGRTRFPLIKSKRNRKINPSNAEIDEILFG